MQALVPFFSCHIPDYSASSIIVLIVSELRLSFQEFIITSCEVSCITECTSHAVRGGKIEGKRSTYRAYFDYIF